jgi:hypothetical protein
MPNRQLIFSTALLCERLSLRPLFLPYAFP